MAIFPSGYSVEHLLRRAGFGARPDELATFERLSIGDAVERLLNYTDIPDDVDSKIQQPGYVSVTANNGQFNPSGNIADARQRWLFRMVHTNRPLEEKMTLFWHNHFATGYNKIAGMVNAGEASRYMAAKPSEDPGRVQGQVEMLRANALVNFRDILSNIAKDTAMLFWLDGNTNTRAQPQENFAREIMELFTMGVGYYTEADVYAGARVFTGWNVQRVTPPGNVGGASYQRFFYNSAQHDTGAKTFSFPIYSDGSTTIPARPASTGMQDGVDFIDALANSPNTARYLAAKLYRFFVSEQGDPDPAFVQNVANIYLQSGHIMKDVMRGVLLSPQFLESSFQRYSWPAEFVVRAIKDVGWAGFSVNNAINPLSNMGQILYEPPDVAGWDAGQTWFSSGAMLARMNFASTLAGNQRFNRASAVKGAGASSNPQAFLSYFLGQLAAPQLESSGLVELSNYLLATGAWTGSDAQLQSKASGLIHLILSSPEYQLQ